MLHYSIGTQDMDTRRIRKNGWNEVINAYMGKLPINWPYQAVVTDPRIRTTITEKTSRLLNSRLQGRLIPREGGDVLKARINNAILDYQWDAASDGGSMLEKCAVSDQMTRIFGASFALVYWDVKKNSNEIKVWDPRDIFFDPSASHIRNAKWVQMREYTTPDALERRGYNVGKLRSIIKSGVTDNRQNNWESQVKANRGLDGSTSRDTVNPTIEVVTEWTPEDCTVFAPKHGVIVYDGDNNFKHKKIPVAQLRYYPLIDDIYGESEVECVIPLARAINAFLCGTIDEMNLAMRPPLKIPSTGVRMETIEYGPGAKWIANDPSQIQEMQIGAGALQAFNNIYPALVAAFNTAMGDQSLGVSNIKGFQTDKTATEVASLEKQQNSRDQYNQLYLSEFLQDIMLMWLSNNKQFLFDDPKKKNIIIKIVGKDKIQMLQQMKLDEMDVPAYAMDEIANTVAQNPEAVSPEQISQIMSDVAVPTNPIVENPDDSPEDYKVKNKLDVESSGEAADLYVEPSDLEGEFDYKPDVKSMAAGAGIMLQQARQKALDTVINPQVIQLLQSQSEMLDIKELLVNAFEDAGYTDAEKLFKPAGSSATGPGGIPNGVNPGQGLPNVPQAVPGGPSGGGMAQATGVPGQTTAPGGVNPGLYP